MRIVSKNQAIAHHNSPDCAVLEYPFGDPDINGAVSRLNGRYPAQGFVTNTSCKEMAYVIEGSGKLVVESTEYCFSKGDMLLIAAGEKYYWEGHMTLFLACTPAWYPEQHKNYP
ncbi:hypothetical protein K2X40_04910 [Candidatus Babeliales bacterium]|nr:hypothetical protein [Candidatus Babeliales bacterium]